MHVGAHWQKIEDSSLANEDLLPVPPDKRTWTRWDLAALWVGMAICIPTYQMAGGLIAQGMNWWQAVLTVLIGNLIVLIPMSLNAHPGTKFGIPFPVLLRASFGTRGSNIAALLRALVACGWFGIQTWIGGSAIHGIWSVLWQIESAGAPLPGLGISLSQTACFLIFWAINLAIVVRGIESIRWMENIAAPFLLLVGAGLLAWAWSAAGGPGPILQQPSRLATPAAFWAVFMPSLTAMVGFWATLSLNIPDFSRFARSQREQVLGQAIGLPGTMAMFAFIGAAVTSATAVVYHREIWDPVDLISQFENKLAVILGLVAVVLATLSTNIAANVVSPANDFSNLAPRWISFRTGGVITCFLGILIQPWHLVADPKGYIFTWLIGYGALLGPIGGIMMADYYVVRKRRLDLSGLYDPSGPYAYRAGFNPAAVAALVLAVAPNLPGFLATVWPAAAASVPPFWVGLYSYSWFLGLGLAFGLYLVFMRMQRAW